MPSYWTPKQERQYGYIKQSCVQRKCRRVKGKATCVRECTRIAAATTNKFRSRGLGSKDLFDPRPHYPMPDAWEPRYQPEPEQQYLNRLARESAKSQASFDRYTVKRALFDGSMSLHQLRELPDFAGRPKALMAALRSLAKSNQRLVEHKGKRWRLSEHYWAQYGGDRPSSSFKGLGDPDARTIPSPPNVTSPCRSLFCTDPALPGTTRCARHPIRGQPSQAQYAIRGCCVVRGKKRIACFHSRKDALALKRSLKKTSGLRIRCV